MVTDVTFGIRVEGVSLSDWPGWDNSNVPDSARPAGRELKRSPRNVAAVRRAIADALGVSPADDRLNDIDIANLVGNEPVERPSSTAEERAERLADPREQAATRWSAKHSVPKHKPTRRSQTYEGRRERHVRRYADQHNMTIAAARQRVKKRGPYGPRPTTEPEQ
jgi:hypothetical protein